MKKKFNVKLSQRYYSPFKILERIGEVTYKLELPPTSLLHSVFHISVLKKQVGDSSSVIKDLPNFDDEGDIVLKPGEAIRYKQRKGIRGSSITWQVLIQ